MTMRDIVIIDEDKCDGCGQCVTACAEGAIEIVDGKAKLISEIYCDGLGACLGECPQDAITIEQREAVAFDEQATEKHLARQRKEQTSAAEACDGGGFACPGSKMQQFRKQDDVKVEVESPGKASSELGHWPVQLMLVSPNAPYFKNAELLLTADCVPFAMADFHSRLLRDKSIAVGCPKLDNSEFYVEKLADIIKINSLKSLAVVHMEVPCCFGLTQIALKAIEASGENLMFEDITINLQGNILKTEVKGA
jgi:Pyruvate/2-oxoacid:ferredoxin oxidoreductase delta subunit